MDVAASQFIVLSVAYVDLLHYAEHEPVTSNAYGLFVCSSKAFILYLYNKSVGNKLVT